MKKLLFAFIVLTTLGACASNSGESIMQPVNFELHPLRTNR